mmetsp:Transcript_16027/g.27069  ORF Transcript_16027/g.27069 Transcript_16027/m.27069 type:complete len:336 (-) Transcript_16027:276-1283(-)
MAMMRYTAVALLAILSSTTEAFVSPSAVASAKSPSITTTSPQSSFSSSSALHALDPVTYLRTEWVSAALCTNQTPRSFDIALQLGTEDGRIVNFVPRTIRKIITSSAEPKSADDGALTVSCIRQLNTMAERRNTAAIEFSNQPADNLKDTPDASVDIVVSFQAAQRMYENGLDFKQSIKEAGRVLKPGGRFLFVESAEVGGESYLDYVMGISALVSGGIGDGYEEIVANNISEDASSIAAEVTDEDSEVEATPPLFEEVGYDNVDMVLQPHIAGIAIKAMDADLTSEERKQMKSQEEEDRLAEMSFAAFERGNKRRKRKKKKKDVDNAGMGMGSE